MSKPTAAAKVVADKPPRILGDIPPEPHALLREPIPHAYALVPDPEHPGLFYAVHVSNVTADQLDVLEPSGRSEKPVFGLQRIERAQAERHYRRGWGREP